jgi:hypothetical protein
VISDDLADDRWKELSASGLENGPTQWDAAKQILVKEVGFVDLCGAPHKWRFRVLGGRGLAG